MIVGESVPFIRKPQSLSALLRLSPSPGSSDIDKSFQRRAGDVWAESTEEKEFMQG